MAACPVCQKGLEILPKHLGSIHTCPHCRAVFYINWDGQPELAQHEPEPVPAPEPEPSAEVEAPMGHAAESAEPADLGAATVIGHVDLRGSETPAADFSSSNPEASETVAEDAAQAEGLFAAENESVPAPELSSEVAMNSEAMDASAEMAGVADAVVDDFSTPLDPFAPVEAPAAEPSSENYSDVAAFANSEADAGPLSYVVHIRGLELAETFERLREALTDSRFGWDTDEVMGRMSSGELTITGLSPTKASILVGRIKYLPIELDWRQEIFREA